MSEICEEHLRIASDEANMYRRLRTSTMFNLMQRISIRQMEGFGIGRDKTLDRGLLWIILRQWAVIERLPEYDEQVTIRSWPGDMMHVIFPRHYEIVSERGETFVRAQALWMLIDQKTRHHIFPDEYGIGVQGLVTGRELGQMPSILLPKNGTSEEFDIPVPYSMVDLNGHLNNTHYFDLAEDHSVRAQSGIQLREVQIEYLSEAKFGSKLHMKLETEGQADFFTASIGEKNCFRMKLVYK